MMKWFSAALNFLVLLSGAVSVEVTSSSVSSFTRRDLKKGKSPKSPKKKKSPKSSKKEPKPVVYINSCEELNDPNTFAPAGAARYVVEQPIDCSGGDFDDGPVVIGTDLFRRSGPAGTIHLSCNAGAYIRSSLAFNFNARINIMGNVVVEGCDFQGRITLYGTYRSGFVLGPLLQFERFNGLLYAAVSIAYDGNLQDVVISGSDSLTDPNVRDGSDAVGLEVIAYTSTLVAENLPTTATIKNVTIDGGFNAERRLEPPPPPLPPNRSQKGNAMNIITLVNGLDNKNKINFVTPVRVCAIDEPLGRK